MKKKKHWMLNCFFLTLFVLLIVVGTVWGIRAYFAKELKERELLLNLNQTHMSQSIQSLALHQKKNAADFREETARKQNEDRIQLKKEFLRKNAEALLTIVNPWNQISPTYQPNLVELGDGMLIDECAAGALAELLKACKSAGGVPCPISGYRTQEYQQELFDNKIKRVIAAGYSEEEAPRKAAESVAVPGTSEHQLGFAMDIVDEYYPELDYAQEWTGTQQWLMQHCMEYGFILRYPSEASDITGIIFEPWHYRYVGKSVAAEIYELGITLEEYVNRSGR